MKALIYGRQSSGDDDYSESVELQIEKCKALAVKEHLEVIGIYSDNNTSGKTYPSGSESIAEIDLAFNQWFASQTTRKKYREGLGEVIKRLSEVDYIIVWDITRLYRPYTGSFLESYMHQLLVAHHIKVWTVSNGVVDFSNFNDSLILALQNRINNEQIHTQTQKCRAALKKLKDNGDYYAGLGRMIGFDNTGRKREVIVNPREAELVKDVFRLFNAAMPINKITQYINEKYQDIFSKPCHRQLLRKILINPVYCGYMRDSNGGMVKSKQLEGKEIVSVDTWMKAFKKLENRKCTYPRQKKHWLPLSAFIYCGQCGDKMISHGGAGGRNQYYTCQRHLRDGKSACKNNITVTNDIKEGVGMIELIKPLLLAEAMKMLKTSKDDSAERKRLSEIELTLSELKRKSGKLTEMWMSSVMDETIYDNAMKEIKSKETELTKEKTSIEMTISRDTSQFEWVKLMMKFKGDGLTNGEYEMLANAMLKKILVYRDFIEVKTTFGEVSLPRQHVGRYRLGCNYIIQMNKGKAAVYFYNGSAKAYPASFWNDAKKIGVLGELDIFYKK